MCKPGGNRVAGAEVGGAEGAQSVPGAADPAGRSAGGGRGAGGLRTQELHGGPAPRHEPNPAGPRHVRKSHADLCLPSALCAQVRVKNKTCKIP